MIIKIKDFIPVTYNKKNGGNFMVNYFNLNVPEELLKEESEQLSLFPSCSLLNELEEFFYGRSEEITAKLIRIKEWIFSLQVNHKELCTSIIYGNVFHRIAVEDGLYSQNPENNQPFYEERTSYFSNHAVDLAFSLGDKMAQLVNIADDVKWDESTVNLFKLLDNGTSLSEQYKVPLKKLYEKRNEIKNARHMKIHKYESDLQKTKVSVEAGAINGRTATIVLLGIDNIPITPYQNLKKCSDFEVLFKEVTNDVLEITCDKLLSGFKDEITKYGIAKIGMGITTELTSLKFE